MATAPHTSLSIEAEAVPREVEQFRERHIEHSGRVIPLHTTLLEFLPPERLTPEVLDRLIQAASAVPQFDYEGVCPGVYPGSNVLWIAPVPVGPFEVLVDRVVEAFPEVRPAWRYPTFHMTVALRASWDGLAESIAAFEVEVRPLLPLRLRALRLTLRVHNGDEHPLHSIYPLGDM